MWECNFTKFRILMTEVISDPAIQPWIYRTGTESICPVVSVPPV